MKVIGQGINGTLSNHAFRSDQELEEIMIADGIKRIGEGCFASCPNTSLMEVVLEGKETKIHQNAFEQCLSLKFEDAAEIASHFVKPLDLTLRKGASGIAGRLRTDRQRRIVVMGGSFNPPTLAHGKLLSAAVNSLNADSGIFVPSSEAYVARKMKKQRRPKEVLSESMRLQMLQLMCEEDKRLTVDDCEFQDDGRGHTFETLQKLQEKNPDATLYFLIGGDKLNIITRWHKSEEVISRFKFAVIKRDGTFPEEQICNHPRLAKNRNIFYMVPEPDGIEGVSSTAVRDKLRMGDENAKELVHPKVWKLLVEAGWLRTEIRSFRGEYEFLSNFYETPIEYEGLRYLNSEAAFQAQKCRTEEEKMEFCDCPPGKAKRRGRQVLLREDWENVKVSLMEEIVRAKFTQHPELAALLLSTGERELLEENKWHDTFWGVDLATDQGENHLGKILMKIRKELRM